MIEFIHIQILWLLFLLPVWAVLAWWHYTGRRKKLRQMIAPGLQPVVVEGKSRLKAVTRTSLQLLGMGCLIMALAQPVAGVRTLSGDRAGIDIVIALDVSRSMTATDITPNRLDRAKLAIDDLLSQIRNDRIALVVFAGDAYNMMPVTTDIGTAKLLSSSVSVEDVPVQGTNMAKAIEVSMAAFPKESSGGKAVIMISDGEDHEGKVEKMAKTAASNGIVIFTVGIGTAEGGAVLQADENGVMTQKTDAEGNPVISKLNPQTLQMIAEATGGMYVDGSEPSQALKKVFDQINRMEKFKYGKKVYTDANHLYQWVLVAGLLFLVLEWLITEQPNRLWKKLGIFENRKS